MRILLLDEVESNIDKIENMLSKAMQEISIVKYTTPFSFVTGIYDEFRGDVDLALIHISDNKDEKIYLAKDIQEYFPHIKLVFYSERLIYAESVFIAKPSFFFKIPSDSKIILKAMERVEKEIEYYNGNCLTILSKGQLIKLRYETINYMESVGRKICIYSTSGNYETLSTMNEMMQQLPGYFFKCHRSYIVNLHKIITISKNGLGLQNELLIPCSREVKDELKLKMQQI